MRTVASTSPPRGEGDARARSAPREEIMIGEGAEAAQIWGRYSSFDGLRQGDSVYDPAECAAGWWQAATATMSRLGQPLRVPMTTSGVARLAGRGAAWTSH